LVSLFVCSSTGVGADLSWSAFFIFFTSFRMTVLDTAKLFQDLTQAYYDTRKHKRNTASALTFEKNYETNLFELWRDIINWTYKISPSICFIIKDPTQREIFAADFRDRIIHHLIYNYIYKIFDRHFIYDSYSCRLGKWTHFGIHRIDHFVRSCTKNYSRDAYILKLDIQGFFMHINKNILFDQIKSSVSSFHSSPAPLQRSTLFVPPDKGELKGVCINHDFLINLIRQVIFHDSTIDCIIKWKKLDWNGLPSDKSLFNSPTNTGLAIGNLTSQLFANIYLDDLDKFIKYKLWCKYYWRYVDDFVIIDTDKQKLLSIIPVIKNFLNDKLHLTLHPKKIYFQHYSKWVQFLGTFIKPYRTYIRKRTIGKFNNKIDYIFSDLQKWLSTINSYLGLCKHHKSFKIRKKICEKLSDYYSFNPNFVCAKIKILSIQHSAYSV